MPKVSDIYHNAVEMTQLELSARTDVYHARRLAILRLCLLGWMLENGHLYTKFHDAWSAFRKEEVPNQKIYLNEDDRKRYMSAIEDAAELVGKPFEPLMVHQLFSMNGEYVGAWFSCSDPELTNLFWIVVDADWNTAVYTKYDDLLKAKLNLTGASGYRHTTYSIGECLCVQLTSGTCIMGNAS